MNLTYLTASRTREIGIRIALGATRFNIVSLTIEYAMVLTAAGVAIGIVLAPIALRLTSGLLFGVGPFDPVTLVTVVAVDGWSVDSRLDNTGRSRGAARVSLVSLKVCVLVPQYRVDVKPVRDSPSQKRCAESPSIDKSSATAHRGSKLPSAR